MKDYCENKDNWYDFVYEYYNIVENICCGFMVKEVFIVSKLFKDCLEIKEF